MTRVWWATRTLAGNIVRGPTPSTRYRVFTLRDISRGLSPFASRHSRSLLSGTAKPQNWCRNRLSERRPSTSLREAQRTLSAGRACAPSRSCSKDIVNADGIELVTTSTGCVGWAGGAPAATDFRIARDRLDAAFSQNPDPGPFAPEPSEPCWATCATYELIRLGFRANFLSGAIRVPCHARSEATDSGCWN